MVDIEKLALIQLLGTNTKRRYAFIGGVGVKIFAKKVVAFPLSRMD